MNDEFLSAIGAVTVEFAVLEQQVHATVWSLLVGPLLVNQQTGRFVTADRSFRSSLDLLASLIRHKFPDRDNADLEALRKRISGVEAERNLIVHSTWALADEGAAMRVKTTASGQMKFLKMTAEDVRAVSRDIHEAAEAVLNLHLALLGSCVGPVTL